MKLAKLSLAAIVVAGLASSSFAADTLADAFKNGKVSGELKAYYFDRDGTKTGVINGAIPNNGVNSSIFTPGVMLNYVTDPLMGLSMGLTFQAAQAPFADTDAKADFKGDMWGVGSVLSQAYVNYAIGKTNIKVGRQFISTPLIAGSGSRIIAQSFEGAVITNTDLPQTTLLVGAVTKQQGRTDGLGGVAKFVDLAHDENAYTLLAINKSVPGLTLTGQYVTLNDSWDDIYLEAAYAGKAASFTYGLAANYLNTNYDAAGVNSGTMYGAMASMGMGDLKGFIAYSTITDKGNVGGLLGSGAQPMYAKGVSYYAGYYLDDSTSMSIDVNYNFKAVGILAGARYTDIKDSNAPAAIDRFGITDLYATYTVQQLKGLAFSVNYQGYTKDADGADIWFKANYKF